MFIDEHYNTAVEQMEEKDDKYFKPSEKFMIGCKALAGIPVDEIIKDSGMSQSYVYRQKKEVAEYAASLDEPKEDVKTIKLTKLFIESVVLMLMLYCRSPLEGVQRFFEHAFEEHISIGKISDIVNGASVRAQAFDDSIRLEGIRQGANDEIFQGSTPILTGIDAESTYIYLMEEGKDRSAETWEIYMEDSKDRGLELETSISDNAAGLKAGVAKVYPESVFQLDTFHASYEMSKEVSKVERKAFAQIKEEYELKKRAEGKRAKQKTKEKLDDAIPKTKEIIEVCDVINILFCWLKELLGFSGYNMEDTITLIEFILKEMESVAAGFPGLLKECEKIRKNLPFLLSYISRLEETLKQSAVRLGIPIEAFQVMYRQLSCGTATQQYQHMDYELVLMLAGKYDEARSEFQRMLSEVKKASSIVENLNGRIRAYINIKRIVPTRFFVLLKVFFNTKRYRRSRVKERVGKSPLELMTGKPQPEFLEALGYNEDSKVA